MSSSEEVKFSVKVMIDNQKTKVLFAEVDSDFADVILSFLTLPLGTIVTILKEHYGAKAPVIGSFNTLYTSLGNLDNAHFWTEGGKQMLLNPRSSFVDEMCQLKLNISAMQPTEYFTCRNRNCKNNGSPSVSMYYNTRKCDCGGLLSRPMGMRGEKTQVDGVFLKKDVSFLITDDLRMAPSLPGSFIKTLVNLGITSTEGAELRTVALGFYKVMELLRWSLISENPLTCTFLRKRHERACITYLQADNPNEMSCSSKKMIVTAVVQKSTNKLLFAQAEDDFVDFLFSLFVIPVGRVKCILGTQATSLGSLDNLYNSILNMDDEYFKTHGLKNRLLEPDLPPMYLSKNNVFSVKEQMTPTIYRFESNTDGDLTVEKGFWMCFKDPKGSEGSYVRRPGKFVITDDLFVTVLGTRSSLSLLSELKIPLSDVEEMEIPFGLEEASSLLKASLGSKTSALTEGLVSPLLKKDQSGALLRGV